RLGRLHLRVRLDPLGARDQHAAEQRDRREPPTSARQLVPCTHFQPPGHVVSAILLNYRLPLAWVTRTHPLYTADGTRHCTLAALLPPLPRPCTRTQQRYGGCSDSPAPTSGLSGWPELSPPRCSVRSVSCIRSTRRRQAPPPPTTEPKRSRCSKRSSC